MKKITVLLFGIIVLNSCSKTPDFVLYSGDRLAQVRKEFRRNPSEDVFVELIHICDSLIDLAPHSVMEKEVVPPSGDKHDYMSQGPYWWPNPNTPDGLPYIRRDGYINPERYKINDSNYMVRMTEDVIDLSLAYYLSGEEKYAKKAEQLLRFWFLYPLTMMNPNLNFAQRIPGVAEMGRGIGIIDVNRMNCLYDSIRMLEGSKAWDAEADKAFKNWVDEFVDWLVTSNHGISARSQKNNHGTYYDLLVCTSYLFLGQTEKAAAYAREFMPRRFDEIASDGAMPRELARTKAWQYSMMNLRGLLWCALAAEKAGVDMWNYKNVNGATIQTAIDWFRPYILEGVAWDYKEIAGAYDPSLILLPFAIASGHCDLSEYSKFISGSDIRERVFLLYPALK